MLNFEVTDRQSFTTFLQLLVQDLQANPESWENVNLLDFLEAMGRYTEDIQGYYDNLQLGLNADAPSWRLFADLLKGATIYE
ncbi:hypothetical protein [Spirosoma sp.]|uniref:DUF7660 family protein n=1 Tax=Spirosoma sp. TaxID=1899569 RepID=UPI002629B36F|nr:hypothetical protein [Spirosoma sp.]MCX6215352.1 hypothetical protein [Spirosoma sp.]